MPSQKENEQNLEILIRERDRMFREWAPSYSTRRLSEVQQFESEMQRLAKEISTLRGAITRQKRSRAA